MNQNIFLLLFALVVLSGCVDRDYDFSDMNNDNIVIGDKIVLPIGKTGDILLNDLIKIDGVNSIVRDDKGNYSIKYNGNFEAQEFYQVTVPDISIPLTYSIPNGKIPLMVNVTKPLPKINIGKVSAKHKVDVNPITATIDSVIMDTKGGENSLFIVNLSMRGFVAVETNAYLEVKLVMPKGFEFSPKTDFTIDENGCWVLNKKIDLNNVLDKTYEIRLNTTKLGKVTSEFTVNAEFNLQINSAKNFYPIANKDHEIALYIDLQKNTSKVAYGKFDYTEIFANESFDLEGLVDLFEEGSTLSFYNPVMKLKGSHNLGLKNVGNLTFASYKDGQKITSLEQTFEVAEANKPMDNAAFNVWFGAIEPNEPATPWQWNKTDVNSLLKGSPDNIVVAGKLSSSPQQGVCFVVGQPYCKVAYELDIPFTAASDFNVIIEEVFKKVFSESLAESLFSSGDIEFFGVVKNSLPLNLSLKLSVLDANGQDLGVDFGTAQIVDGSSNGDAVEGNISFKAKPTDLENMRKAVDVKLSIRAYSADNLAGIQLNSSDAISIDFSLRKNGGITINNKK